MNIVRKGILPVAGLAVLVLVMNLTNPGAAHALAATLVQIVNTPSNSVPTVHAPPASQIDSKGCGSASPYTYDTLECPSFTIESGKTFVVQTVTISVSVQHGVVPVTASLDAPAGWPVAYVPLLQQGSKDGIDTYVGTLSGASVYLTAGSTAHCGATLSGPGTSGYHHFVCMLQGYKVPSL